MLQRGTTLVELLVAMAIASITGFMILQVVLGFQSRILAEISRNDLQDRQYLCPDFFQLSDEIRRGLNGSGRGSCGPDRDA